MISLISLATTFAGSAFAAHVNYNLFVANGVVAPDGFPRDSVLVGTSPTSLQFPGPLLTATKGDTLSVTVHNGLTNNSMALGTTINFSGLQQGGLPQFDGQTGVTQCPISPGLSYTYTINTSDIAGTHLYRSGYHVQYVDGLRGGLIVYDPDDPQKHLYDVDDASTVFQLGEWYHGPSPPDMASFLETGHIVIYDSGLINGVGRYVGGPTVPYPVFDVVSGTRYRFRLISNSPRAVMSFIIDQHNFTIIEADGTAVTPFKVEAMTLYPGQRYSVVFTANQPVDNYWLRAYPSGGNQAANPNLNANFSQAIVRYKGAPVADPVTEEGVDLTINHDGNLTTLINPGIPGGPNGKADVTLFLNFTTGPTAENPLDTWRVNNISYVAPTLPTLYQILKNNDSFPVDSDVMIIEPNAIVDLVMPLGDDGGGHPIHIHGTQFNIILPGDAGGVENLVNPVRRDIIPVIGDLQIARFRMPAVGILHINCHIIWHAEAGLQWTLITPPDTIRASVKPNADWEALCPAWFALPSNVTSVD